jgi:hypothetical protein
MMTRFATAGCTPRVCAFVLLSAATLAGTPAALAQKPGDGWQQELLDAAGFAAGAPAVLQSPEVLTAAGARPSHWWVVRTPVPGAARVGDWVLHFQGAGWALYQSAGGAEPAAPAMAKGLAGCPQAR